MRDLLEKLCMLPAVSGNEKALSYLVLEEVSPYCESAYIDRVGNVICEKKGNVTPKSKIMLAAHLDEVGFIITAITSEGLLKFSSVGGVDARIYPAKRVLINSKEPVLGVVGIVPTHLLSASEKTAAISEDSLYIDIGASSLEEAQRLVSIGDVGVPDESFCELSGGKIIARALDDRCGVAILTELLKGEVACDITVCFTVMEEVGCRGAQMLAPQIAPQISVVLDSTTACDINGVDEENSVCTLGCGAAVSFMDRGCIYDRELYSVIMKTAEEKNLPAQPKRAVAGGNDSSAISKSAGGVRAAAISLPCRYLHTSSCVIDYSDMKSTLKLVREILEPFSRL